MAAKYDTMGDNENSVEPAGQERFSHIVVLGAGFGGLTFAKRFPDGLARVTVVDRTSHHLTYKRGARVIYTPPVASSTAPLRLEQSVPTAHSLS